MIAFLRGVVIEKASGSLILDVGGVGYQLSVSNNSLDKTPPVGREAALHVHTHVREDALQLFGFVAKSEKDLFERLIGVSGIGPKVALSVLSSYEVDDLKRAIVEEDTAVIVSIPGIGKKTAQRIILELKEKLSAEGIIFSGVRSTGGAVYSSAHEALLALGYTASEAADSLEGYEGAQVVEELVKFALKRLAVK